MKNILIATDFSPHARHTLEFVLKFIRNDPSPCRILILNTYVIPMQDGMKSDQVILMNDELKIKSKEGLERERLAALKLIRNSNIIIDTSSHIGLLRNVIRQIMKQEKIDLVAMGKDGGNQVEKVAIFLKENECPLLTTYLAS